MIKTIVVAMLLLSISVASASAKGKKVEPQKVAAGGLQPHILDKFTSCKYAKAAGIRMFLSHLATLHQDGDGVPMLTKMGLLVRRNKDE